MSKLIAGAVAGVLCAAAMTGTAGAVVNREATTEHYRFMASIPETVPSLDNADWIRATIGR